MALPPMEGKPLNVHFGVGGRRVAGELQIEYVTLMPGADPDRPVYQVIDAKVKPCPRARSTKGWRVLLFWRIIHKRRCQACKLWGDIKRGHLIGFSMGGHVKARRSCKSESDFG